MIVQGSKEFLLGDSRYYYDPNHYLITALELPSLARSWKRHQNDLISAFALT